MDINEIRNTDIQLYNLLGADKVYTFYYDETNNIRKLYLTESGLNVSELKVFVLGGVVHTGPPRPLDIQPLRKELRLQNNISDIKLKHLAKGDFLNILNSKKLTTFLQWLTDSRLLIHYHSLDPLYWSIVDIIDSIIPRLNNNSLIAYHALLKSDLAEVLRSELPVTTELFHRYSYPGLAPENRKPFLNELITLVENTGDSLLPPFNVMMLKGILEAGLRLDELVFIEGFSPHLLIDNFSVFYLKRLAIFKYSHHVLDVEPTIQELFAKYPLMSDGKQATHYRFADSKAEVGIQLADIVAGLLGKMRSYFAEISAEEVAAVRTNLVGNSLRNAELLRDLITDSENENLAFLNHVASMHDLHKVDIFLRFHDGEYAD